MPRELTEAQFQAQVVQLAELLHWPLVGHISDSRKQAGGRMVGDSAIAGIPDLILVRRNDRRVVWAELKVEGGRLSGKQRSWLDELAAAGAETYLWRPSDLAEIQRLLSKPWRYLPRGERHTGLGRLADEACLTDPEGVRAWTPSSLWLAGEGRADERKVAA